MENLRGVVSDCLILEPPYFDQAAIDTVVENGVMRVRYNTRKIVELLQSQDRMSEDDAWEWFYFNIEGAYMGPTTPIYLDPDAEPDEDDEDWDDVLENALDGATLMYAERNALLFEPNGERNTQSAIGSLFWAGFDNKVQGACWDATSKCTQSYAYWRAGRLANPIPYFSNPASKDSEF